jgi:hypothetical protein
MPDVMWKGSTSVHQEIEMPWSVFFGREKEIEMPWSVFFGKEKEIEMPWSVFFGKEKERRDVEERRNGISYVEGIADVERARKTEDVLVHSGEASVTVRRFLP